MKTVFFKLLFIFICIGLATSCDNEPTGAVANMSAIPLAPCDNGMADIYPCDGYDLMSYMSLDDLTPGTGGNLSGNDSWGWTDPTTNKEYALVGLNSHAAFVDISNPIIPILVGILPTATVNSSWRDIKVYQNHAFIVSEANGHGMQVFDLTRLRSVANAPETFTADTNFTEFGKAHNIFINETSGYAYVVGTDSAGLFLEAPYL